MKYIVVLICMLLIGTVLPVSGIVIVERTPISTSLGDTLYVGGSGPGNYSTIQEAIDNASDGDTVFVYDDSSPYYENLVVNKTINLIGENKDTTVIDGGSETVVYVIEDWVTISGFTIQGDLSHQQGINIYCSSHSTVSDNIITNNWDGLHLLFSSDNTLVNNNVNGNYDGIWLGNSSNNTVTSNTVTSNQNGGIIMDHSSNHNTISSNTVSLNQEGIGVINSSKNTITDNSVNLNHFNGIQLHNSTNNNITGNNISSNNYDGISLYDYSNNNYISDNIISNNLWGIYLSFSGNNTITRNTITSNGNAGIRITDSSNNNYVTGNTFSSNWMNHGHGHIVLLSSSFNVIKYNNFIRNLGREASFGYHLPGDYLCNCWNENYWNRPRILPKPIFGMILIGTGVDVLLIPWIQFDWHPAKAPYDIS